MARTPANLGEITKEWLQFMLSESSYKKKISIDSFHVDAGSNKGDNFVSSLAAVEITTTEGEKIRFMVKLAPEGEFKQDFFNENMMFEKEANVYKILMKDLEDLQIRHFGKIVIEVPFPKCYYVHGEDDGRAVIVMEDLRESGYRMFDKSKNYDRAHTLLVLEGIARFHALTFALKMLDGTKIADKYPWAIDCSSSQKQFMMIIDNSINSLTSILGKFPGQEENVERIKAFAKKIPPSERYLKFVTSREPMAVITHGDFWNNNMMYKYEEGKEDPVGFMLIDLQIIKYNHPAADLVYFLYTSTDGDFRRNYLKRVLRHYYDNFMGVLQKLQVPFGPKDYSFETFEKEFEEHIELGFIMASMIVPMILAKADAIPDFSNASKEEAKVLLDQWYQNVAGESTELGRSRVMSLIEEMKERGII